MKPVHAAMLHAGSRRATAAAGFSLVEVVVVILLLLALASIALPVATSWFSDAAAEQTLDSIVLAVRDEQLEAMVSRTPRAVWIASGDAATPIAQPAASVTTGKSNSSRWRVGGERLGRALNPAESGAEASPDPAARRESVVLPRGWTLVVESASSAAALATADELQGPGATLVSGSDAPTRLVVFWPGGQVDVLGRLLVDDGQGHVWAIELDPWTGVPAWRARGDEADDAAVADKSAIAPKPDASP